MIYKITQEGSFCFIPPSQRSLNFNISFQLVYLKARPNTFLVTNINCIVRKIDFASFTFSYTSCPHSRYNSAFLATFYS